MPMQAGDGAMALREKWGRQVQVQNNIHSLSLGKSGDCGNFPEILNRKTITGESDNEGHSYAGESGDDPKPPG